MAIESKIDVGDVVVWCVNRDVEKSGWGIGIVAGVNRLDYMNPYEIWTINSYLMKFGHMNHGFFREENLTVISKCDFWPRAGGFKDKAVA